MAVSNWQPERTHAVPESVRQADERRREQRAQILAAGGHIVRLGDAWLVQSASSDRIYRVTLDGDTLRCTCPDFQKRGERCKHILAAAFVNADYLRDWRGALEENEERSILAEAARAERKVIMEQFRNAEERSNDDERARWTSPAAGDLAVSVAYVMRQARIAKNPTLRSHLAWTARQQWREALVYERKLVAFNAAIPFRDLSPDEKQARYDATVAECTTLVAKHLAPRPLAAFIGSSGLHVDTFVAAAFDQALDGETIDERFLAQAGAIAAIEALAMAVFQRPLTYRDRLMLGMETVRHWNQRAAATRRPEPTEATELQHRYSDWLADHQAGAR